MNITTKVIALAVALMASCFGQSFGIADGVFHMPPPRTETRTVELPGHFYIISYEISGSGLVLIPAVYGGENKPHHDARVSVFEIREGARRQIGKVFDGQFVDGGCFEDDPESMVLRAYDSVPQDVKAAIEAKRETARFEAQPLFQQEMDGSLTITAKGERDLQEIRVGERVVWRNPNPRTGTYCISERMIPVSCSTSGIVPPSISTIKGDAPTLMLRSHDAASVVSEK